MATITERLNRPITTVVTDDDIFEVIDAPGADAVTRLVTALDLQNYIGGGNAASLWPRIVIDSDRTLSAADAGGQFFYDEVTNRTLNLEETPAIPVDSAFAIRVGPTAGTLTVDGDTTVIISWFNGTDYTSTSAGGAVSLGVGLYTLWKNLDTHYYLDGPNIS